MLMYVRTRFHPFKNCFEQCRAESTRQSDTYRSDPTRIDPTRIGHVSSRSVFVISFQCWPISIFLFSSFLFPLERWPVLIFLFSEFPSQPCGGDAPTIASPCEVNNMAMAMFQWLAKKVKGSENRRARQRKGQKRYVLRRFRRGRST